MKTFESKKDEIKNIGEKKDINHIWDEINESTEGIFLHYYMSKKKDAVYRFLPPSNSYGMTRFPASEEEFRERFPNFIVINLYDYAPNSIYSFKGMPQNLPNLSILGIKSHKFRSLEGLPKELPNLKKLSIENSPLEYLKKDSNERKIVSIRGSPLSNLKGLPKELPNLENLFISNSQITDISDLPERLPSLKTFIINTSYPLSLKGSLKSLKGIPNKLPSLEIFGVQNNLIQTLEHIPSSLPKLKRFAVSNCLLRNLRHFPKDVPNLEELFLNGNGLASLEGLPPEIPKLKKLNLIDNNLTSLKYLPQNIDRNARIEIENNPLRSLCYLNHNFTFVLMFRYKKIKGFELGSRFDEFMNNFLVTRESFNEETGEMELGKFINMQVIEQLKEYYRKTTNELIQQYISNPESVSEDELERIIWEADIEGRNVLESNFPADNVVLQKIKSL
ncbi:MAG: leucine-rich repeat domain-containing protein [Promethearchaeota archaeon]